MFSSPQLCVQQQKPQFEIWVYVRGPNNRLYREPVEDCGLFETEEEACAIGAAVRLWVREERWTESVLGPRLDRNAHPALPHQERTGLMLLPTIIREQGFDPTLAFVTAGSRDESEGDHADPENDATDLATVTFGAEDEDGDEDGWDDPDATTLAPPDTGYSVEHGGEPLA